MRNVSALVAVLLLGAGPAVADKLVASRHDGGWKVGSTWFLDRVTDAKVIPVAEEPSAAHGKAGIYAWAFSAADTVWVLRRVDPSTVQVGVFVAGKRSSVRDVTLADWKLAHEPIPADEGDGSPGILVTKSGEVWLEKCQTARGPNGCKQGYLRVDTVSTPRPKRPEEIVFEWDPATGATPIGPAALAATAAPVGYSAGIKKVKIRKTTFVGMTCQGPHGALAWPEPMNSDLTGVTDDEIEQLADEGKVTGVQWVSASPPILRYTVQSSHATWSTYVSDCARERSSPVLLEQGRWVDGGIVRRADGSELGRLRGDADAVAAP